MTAARSGQFHPVYFIIIIIILILILIIIILVIIITSDRQVAMSCEGGYGWAVVRGTCWQQLQLCSSVPQTYTFSRLCTRLSTFIVSSNSCQLMKLMKSTISVAELSRVWICTRLPTFIVSNNYCQLMKLMQPTISVADIYRHSIIVDFLAIYNSRQFEMRKKSSTGLRRRDLKIIL